jgi:hypothetical protein
MCWTLELTVMPYTTKIRFAIPLFLFLFTSTTSMLHDAVLLLISFYQLASFPNLLLRFFFSLFLLYLGSGIAGTLQPP